MAWMRLLKRRLLVCKSPSDRLPPLLEKPRRLALLAVVSSGLIEAAAGGVAAVATRDLFEALGTQSESSSWSLLFLAFAGVLAALSRGGVRISSEWVGRHYAGSVRKALYKGLSNTRWSDVAKRRRSTILIRFVGDLGAFRDWAGRGLADVVVSVVVVPVSISVLLIMNPMLAAAGLLPLALGTAMGLFASLELPKRHSALRQQRGVSAGVLGERALLAPLLDQLGRTPHELRRLDREAESLRRSGVSRASIRSFARGAPEAGAALGGAAILAVAISQGVTTGTTAGALAALTFTAAPLASLGRAWDRFANWRIARDRVDRILTGGSPLPQRSKSKRALGARQVSDGLKRLGLDASRSGKLFTVRAQPDQSVRSLLRQLSGLEGIDLFLLDRQGRIPRIGLISEDASLMKGSVRRNICLGVRKRPADEKLDGILMMLGLVNAQGKPIDLDMPINEEGRLLELDVKARLLFARAVVMRAQVFLCDDRLLNLLPERAEIIEQVQVSTGAPVVVMAPPNV